MGAGGNGEACDHSTKRLGQLGMARWAVPVLCLSASGRNYSVTGVSQRVGGKLRSASIPGEQSLGRNKAMALCS